jgi:hypothetical protein
MGKYRHVRLPGTIVGGRDCHPPEHNESKTGEDSQKYFAVFPQDQRTCPAQDQESHEPDPKPFSGEIGIENSQGTPGQHD